MGLTSGVTSITMGEYFACATTAGGGVMCWGYNGYGQLGDGTTNNSSVPVQVTGLTSGASSLSAGYESVCAVVGCGVQCWGTNGAGQLGNDSTTNSSVPVSTYSLGASPCP
jgi:alpha-tubulin suppressor-like RCC1 family protein